MQRLNLWRKAIEAPNWDESITRKIDLMFSPASRCARSICCECNDDVSTAIIFRWGLGLANTVARIRMSVAQDINLLISVQLFYANWHCPKSP